MTDEPTNPSHRRSWLTIGAIFGVGAVLAGVLIAVNGSSGGDSPSNPTSTSNVGLLDDDEGATLVRTVEQYYAAVRAGNAAKALSLGAPVQDRRLLTDTALRTQRALGAIDRVRVDPDVLQIKNTARVDVVVTVGGKAYDETIEFTRAGDDWQMPAAAEIGSDVAGSPSFTIFGTKFGPTQKAYVFPGTVRGTLDSPFVTLTAGGTDVAPVPGPSNALGDQKYGLNKTGTAAVRAAVQRAMATCAASRTLFPDDAGCPNSTISTTGPEVTGSVRWTAPTDYTSLVIDDVADGPRLNRLSVTADVTFSVTYRVRQGNRVGSVRETVEERLYGSVDLTTSPPTYTG